MKLKEKWKKKYIGDRSFYRRYLLLAVPMILQNAITNLVSFLDNIMVGQLGTGADVGSCHCQSVDFCVHILRFLARCLQQAFLVHSISVREITRDICIHFALSCMRHFW